MHLKGRCWHRFHNQTHIINSKHIQSLTRILNLNREENEIYVSDSHKSRREREFFLQNLENREEKENENSIFSSERERARSVFLEISRDSRLLLMSVEEEVINSYSQSQYFRAFEQIVHDWRGSKVIARSKRMDKAGREKNKG